MSEDFDWKKIAVAAGKLVAGVGKVAAGATGGPAAAQGVADAETGIYGALDGFGVQVPGAAQGAPADAQKVTPQVTPPAPVVTPPAPKMTPPVNGSSLVATPPGTTSPLDMRTALPEVTGEPSEVTSGVAAQLLKVTSVVSQPGAAAPLESPPTRREPSRLDSFERGGRLAALSPTQSANQIVVNRVDRFDREVTRTRPLPAAPPGPTAQEQESQALVAVLVDSGWTTANAQLIERGRTPESLRLLGRLSPGRRVPMFERVPIAESEATQVVRLGTLSDGRVTRLGSFPAWTRVFALYRILSTPERKVIATQLLRNIDSARLESITLPVNIELPDVKPVSDPMALISLFDILREDEQWLVRKAIEESEQGFSLHGANGG